MSKDFDYEIIAIGISCFAMSLVGLDEMGIAITPVYSVSFCSPLFLLCYINFHGDEDSLFNITRLCINLNSMQIGTSQPHPLLIISRRN